MAAVDVTALPVELALAGSLGARVRRHVEGSLGWQVVDGTVFPAAVVLRGTDDDPRVGGPPTILVVEDDAEVGQVALASSRAAAVVAWPSQAGRLAEVVSEVLQDVALDDRRTIPLVLGGAAGGVGTSTVALAIAGLQAWAGRPTLAVVRGPLLTAQALDLRLDALVASGCWDAAPSVGGVPDLRVVRVDEPWRAPPDLALPVSVVVDAGVRQDVDILVVRRDRVGVEAMRDSPAGAVVVLDSGVVPRRVVAAAAGGRQVVPVSPSVRVARAHATRRVPVGLPGRWLSVLAPLVTS